MKRGLYIKLAWTGMMKNKKMYIPYALTCIGMVMMFYIISFLSYNQTVGEIPGGTTMQMILVLGSGVIGVFSVIFLFYTNSFLMRRRKKEFGLYNILGMGKWNLGRILIWECLIIAGLSFVLGIGSGILFSKLGELLMIRILKGETNFSFHISWKSIQNTLLLFGSIFLILLLNSLRQIHLSNPIELLKSEEVGEKPPKANWILAVLGIVFLAWGYYLAVAIDDPATALFLFFGAAILVIIATYFLFIAGSVVFCRILQKRKTYYYKTNHFISVSSMMYRMKRNGAGLASICILSTMVLVILSSTACLYLGTEASLRTRYPRDIVVDTYSLEENNVSKMHTMIHEIQKEYGQEESNVLNYQYVSMPGFQNGVVDTYSLEENNVSKMHTMIHEIQKEYGQEESNVLNYQYVSMPGFQNGDQIILDSDRIKNLFISYQDVRQIFIVPLSEYNRLMQTEEELNSDEVLLYCTKSDYKMERIQLEDIGPWKVKKQVADFVDNGTDAMQITSSIFLFVDDLQVIEEKLKENENINYQEHDYYGFDLSCDDTIQSQIKNRIEEEIIHFQTEVEGFPKIAVEGIALERSSFYALYGGLFFLGVLLGIVFIVGAVLIMYYKQVTEGYEDQERFRILQKVGMTKKEIQKSINSQVLTVFFLPLLVSGVHICFAFPLIQKMLVLFSLTDLKLLIGITVMCYLIFGIFYVIVYIITSRSYFRIVSEKDSFSI